MFGDLAKMMKLAGELRTRLPEMRCKLENARFTADAGGGAVAATVNGRGVLVDLKIDMQAIFGRSDPPDAGQLSDLVKGAVSAAQEKAAAGARQSMTELTGGMEIPGLTDMM